MTEREPNQGLLQTFIYTRKFFRTQKKDSLISIGMGIVIFLLVLNMTKNNMFQTFNGTKSGFFSIVSACIWIGIFNSIQLVCREKNDIVKDELDKGLSPVAYMGAHFIYQFLLCLLQSIIIIIMYAVMIDDCDVPEGVIGSAGLEIFITIFLVIYAADALALIISSVVSTPVVAMTVMPLVLILQLVMAGVIFPLESDLTKGIANFTVSKWGMNAFGCIGNINGLPYSNKPELMEINGFMEQAKMNYAEAYEQTSENLLAPWGMLILFIGISFVASVIALKMTTKRLKK